MAKSNYPQEDAYKAWKDRHLMLSPSPPANFFFETVDDFYAREEEAKKAGGIIFCRLSPLSRAYATPFSIAKQPAIFLGAVDYGQGLSLPEKLEFSQAGGVTGEASKSNVVFPMTSKVVLTTWELEALRLSFQFIRLALTHLAEEVDKSDGEPRQQDFKISPEVSVTVKSLGSKVAGEISVYRQVSDEANSRSFSQGMTFSPDELANLFFVYYDALLDSLESMFSSQRPSAMAPNEVVRRTLSRITAVLIAKADAEGDVWLSHERPVGKRKKLLSITRRFTVAELQHACSSILPDYIPHLLTKLITRKGFELLYTTVRMALVNDWRTRDSSSDDEID